jgi:hypothetical protein
MWWGFRRFLLIEPIRLAHGGGEYNRALNRK